MVNEATTIVEPLHATSGGPEEERMDQTTEPVRQQTLYHNTVREDINWQSVRTQKQRKQEALERRRGSVKPQDPATPPKNSLTTRRVPRPPPLPKNDYKIIIRPNQGLPLRNVLTHTLARAIIDACQNEFTDDKFILRINPGSNIAILSTQYEEVAEKARHIHTLTLSGRSHAVRAYTAHGEGTLRGVVHGIPLHTTTETLMAHLRVRTQGVEILTARMIGATQSAALTFIGPLLPRFVYYYGGELRCYPFRPTLQVCKICREKGHRTDVCPNPDRPICRLCGLLDPTDGHKCEINCASCGEAHPTGDHSCKQRLKPVRLRPAPSSASMKPKAPRWFASEDEEDTYRADTRGRPDNTEHRSRSRSPSREHQAPPTPKRNPSPPAKKQKPSHEVSWAEVVSPKQRNISTPITQNPEYQRVIEENRQQKQRLTNYELKIETLMKRVAMLESAQAGIREQLPQSQLPQLSTLTAHPPLQAQISPTSQASTPKQPQAPTPSDSNLVTQHQLQQVLQQSQEQIVQQIQQQFQQFFAEFQELKKYVNESLTKEPKRKRKNSKIRSQTEDAERMLNSDTDSTIASKSHHGP